MLLKENAGRKQKIRLTLKARQPNACLSRYGEVIIAEAAARVTSVLRIETKPAERTERR